MTVKLSLNELSSVPLYQQIFQQLRELILAGQIPAGSRLPSSRDLASDNNVARVTVTQAYDQLLAEGFVMTRRGAGTYVIDELVMPWTDEPPKIRFSTWGERVLKTVSHRNGHHRKRKPRADIEFGFGQTFPHIFPYDIWRRLLARYLSTDDALLSRYGSAAGFHPLREALTDYLYHWRGVRCHPEQVVIVSGVQQALDILARLLISSGDEVLVETPGYMEAYELFRVYGAKLTPFSVGDAGFPVDQLPAGSKAKLTFITPANQFPQGGAMPLADRLSLLRWAVATNSLIIEDDYDGELRYEGRPLGALQGLDDAGRVIYLGTFSKVLFPTLRLGYMVLPEPLVKPVIQAKRFIDRGTATLTQAAVTDFITEGHFERHVRRLREVYGSRHGVLLQTLADEMPAEIVYSKEPAGQQILLRLPTHMDEKRVIERATEAGVKIYPGATYHLQQPAPPTILLGFGPLNERQIMEGIGRLAKVISDLL